MKKIGILFLLLLLMVSDAVAQELIEGNAQYLLVNGDGSDTSLLNIDFMYVQRSRMKFIKK